MLFFRVVMLVFLIIIESGTLFAASSKIDIGSYKYLYSSSKVTTTSLGDKIATKEELTSKMNFSSMFSTLKKNTNSYKVQILPSPSKAAFFHVLIEYAIKTHLFDNSDDISKIYDSLIIYKQFICNPKNNTCSTYSSNSSNGKEDELKSFRKLEIDVRVNKDFIEQIFKNGRIDPWAMRFEEAWPSRSSDEAIAKFNKVKSVFKDTDYCLLLETPQSVGAFPVVMGSELDIKKIYQQKGD